MSKNDTLSQMSYQSRLAIQAFAKLGVQGREVLHALLNSNTKFMAVDPEDTMKFYPADSKFRIKEAKDSALNGLDFRVLLSLMRAGFGEMPKEAKKDDKERYRRFWVPNEVWETLVSVREHLRA